MAQNKRPRKKQSSLSGLLTTDEFCNRVGISRATEDRWRRVDGIMPHYKIGGRIYYGEQDVEQVLNLFRKQPEAAP